MTKQPVPHCDAVDETPEGQPLLRGGQGRELEDVEFAAWCLRAACALLLITAAMGGASRMAGMWWRW